MALHCFGDGVDFLMQEDDMIIHAKINKAAVDNMRTDFTFDLHV